MTPLTPNDYQFYRPQPRPKNGWPPRDTPDAMLNALNYAHDKLHVQEKINLQHQARIDRLESKLRIANIKLWVMGAALMVLWEIFKAVVLHR